MLDGGIARARANEASDGVTQLTELLQLRVDHGELLLGPCSHRTARCALTRAEREQLFRLAQREAELRRVADEMEAGHRVFAVVAIAGLRSARLRKDPDAFVVPDGLDVDPHTLRQRADGEGLVAHAGSMGPVPNYRVKGLPTHFCREPTYSASTWCTSWMQTAPSPTADATRLTLLARTSPTAKTRG